MSNNNVATIAETGQAPKHYGGTVTVDGRNLITSLLAGETIEFTRILVGSGVMPEGVEPIDMKGLVNPVAEATSTYPVVENGEMFMVVEYRNDMNGGLEQSFWLSEFGIFAKTANSPEVCLYYATLGDSPQPVNAYQDNRIDIRRYPVTIALAVDADLQVSYNPGAFVTAEEAADMVKGLVNGMLSDALGDMATLRIENDYIVPTDGWEKMEVTEDEPYAYRLVILDPEITESHVPFLALDRKSQRIAGNAGLCPSAETQDGALYFFADEIPEGELHGTLTLMANVDGGKLEGFGYVLPVASADTLGGVKIPADSGLNVDDDGNLRINTASDGVVDDTIDGIYGEGSSPGTDSDGDDTGSDDGPSTPDGYTVATDKEVQDTIQSVFGKTNA